ncbi:MAG: sulfotransferase [Planctomycetaceae bacterium]|nr:MAG: sulfotransferase [Planctomycetaceae bacterium]
MLGSPALLKAMARLNSSAREHVRMAKNSWRLYDAIASADDTRWVVDASKNAIRMKVLYLTSPERFKVVHLVRDGRAVAASACRRRRISVAKAARNWRNSARAVLLMLKTVPASRQCLLHYEDLCDDPAGQLQKLCHFLGLPFEHQLESLRFRIPHGVPGNRMALDRPTRIVKDEHWKTEMSEDDLQTFERVAGRLNRALGYD